LLGAYVVTGYGWVKAKAPDSLAFREAGGKVHLERLEAGRRYAFDSASGRALVLLDSKRGLAFAFGAGGPGVTLEYTAGDLVLHTPLHDAELTPVAWVTLCNPWNPYRQDVTDLAALVSAAEHLGLGGRPPVEYKWRFGGAEQPEVTYSLTPPVGAIEPALAVPVPACGLAGKPDFKLANPAGGTAVWFCKHKRFRLNLPEEFYATAPEFTPLPPKQAAWLEEACRAILVHQQTDGRFTFSRGRPFYDGITATALGEIVPLLPEALRRQVEQAVRRTLNYWWGKFRHEDHWGLWYFPEPGDFKPLVDYPEITSTLLQATLVYCVNADPGYCKGLLDKLELLEGSLAKAFDPCGSAYAYGGPEYTHLIVEGTIGGYLALQALWHLERLAGKKSDELRAQAALARAALALYRLPAGVPGLASEVFQARRVRVKEPEAWAYTMYTWFSYVAAFKLPADDRYRVWRTLEEVRWWQYGAKSGQRAYDFADYCALVRSGHLEEAKAHFNEVFGAHTNWHWEYFDGTPVLALPALGWEWKLEKEAAR